MKANLTKNHWGFYLGVTALLLACSMPYQLRTTDQKDQPDSIDMNREDYLTSVAQFRDMPGEQRAQDILLLSQLSGEQTYQSSIPPGAQRDFDCDMGYPEGSNVAVNYEYQPDAGDILNDRLILTDSTGTFTYLREMSPDANRFCNYPGTGLYECITVSDNGFQRQIFLAESRSLCYAHQYTLSTASNGIIPPPLSSEQPASGQPENCDGVSYLEIKVEMTDEHIRTDENSGEVEEIYCEYVIHYTNTSNRPMVPFIYQLYKYEDKNETKWLRYPVLEPGQSGEYRSDIQEYPNSLKHPKFVDIAQRLGAYDAAPACSYIADDDQMKEQLSLPIIPPCMVISP